MPLLIPTYLLTYLPRAFYHTLVTGPGLETTRLAAGLNMCRSSTCSSGRVVPWLLLEGPCTVGDSEGKSTAAAALMHRCTDALMPCQRHAMSCTTPFPVDREEPTCARAHLSLVLVVCGYRHGHVQPLLQYLYVAVLPISVCVVCKLLGENWSRRPVLYLVGWVSVPRSKTTYRTPVQARQGKTLAGLGFLVVGENLRLDTPSHSLALPNTYTHPPSLSYSLSYSYPTQAKSRKTLLHPPTKPTWSRHTADLRFILTRKSDHDQRRPALGCCMGPAVRGSRV